MTTTDFDRDDLEEVLNEILRDPGSRLLRTPTASAVVRAVREEPVGPNAPGLTVAERHLLAVHRWSMVSLLCQECVDLLMGEVSRGRALDRFVTPTKTISVRTERARAIALGRATQLDPSSAEFLQPLWAPLGAVGIPQLAGLLRRFSKLPYGDLYESTALVQAGRLGAALERCRDAIESSPPFLKSYAFQNASFIFYRSGEFRQAAEACEMASDCAPGRPTPVMNWMVASLLAADLPSAERASARLSDLVGTGSEAVMDYCSAIHEKFAAAPPPGLGEARRLAGILASTAGEGAKRVLDVIHE